MANYLILNQPQVFNGLGTLTYVIGTTGAYNVRVQTTVPEAVATGDGAGSGTGLGSGAGGGGEGFTGGDLGPDNGGVGQGFGAGNGYQQPPPYGSNESAGDPVSSEVSIIVKDNGTPIYTASTLSENQSAIEFKTSFLATATHTITVVLASSKASDNQLNGVKSIISISEGL